MKKISDQKIHDLKCDWEAFHAVSIDSKRCEIRFNDRNYKVGDILRLRCTQHTGQEMRENNLPLVYVGNPLDCTVTHVQSGYGLQDGWVALSFARKRVRK